MYRATFEPGSGWEGGIEPYGTLQLHPSAQVLNYGQSIFEGMKAQRSAKGRIVVFRPDENAARMMAGAFHTSAIYSAGGLQEYVSSALLMSDLEPYTIHFCGYCYPVCLSASCISPFLCRIFLTWHGFPQLYISRQGGEAGEKGRKGHILGHILGQKNELIS